MPTLKTPDGAELDEAEVNRRFAQSMAAPEPDEPIAPAPEPNDPAQDPEPPAPTDKASHSRTRAAKGTPARGGRRGRGRPPKAAAAPAVLPEGTFTQAVAETLEALAIGGALVPLPTAAMRTRVRLQAQLVSEHTLGLASAIDGAARHNATIRRGVEALTQGSAGWILPAVVAVAPFAAQTLNLWRSAIDEDMAKAAEAFETDVKSKLVARIIEQGEDASATG